eukprot:NODE_339_length_10647_cov_0.388320.p3 type:complete len:333 gc:universal NODE_339_length_10647_cov_0.388320:5013-4015(-)
MSIQDVPREILSSIAQLCSISTISRLNLVDKGFSSVLNDDYFWRIKYNIDYEECKQDPEKLIISNEWKRIYRHRFLTLKNWNTGKYKSTKLYYEDNGVIRDISFTSLNITRHIHMCVDLDSKLVVSVSIRGNGVVWSLESGKAIASLRHGEKIKSAAINGSIVATASNDGIIRVWNFKTFTSQEYIIPRVEVSTMILKSDMLYCGNEQGQLIIINMETQKVDVINAHEAAITCIEANELYIATGSLDRRVNVWGFNLNLVESFTFITQIYCLSLVGSELFIGYSKGLHHIHILKNISLPWFNSPNSDEAVLTVKATNEKVYYTNLGSVFNWN